MVSPFQTLARANWRVATLGVPIVMVAGAAAFFACQAFGEHPGGQAASTLSTQADAGMPWCLGDCMPDPGSGPVDCTIEQSVDTLPLMEFDDSPTCDALGQNCLTAQAADMYTYSDGTAQPFYINPPYTPACTGYQPPTEDSHYSFAPSVNPPTLCRPNNYVVHLVGGILQNTTPDQGTIPPAVQSCATIRPSDYHPTPFHSWGGGIGIALQKLNSSNGLSGDTNKAFCDPQGSGPNIPSLCPPSTEEYAVQVAALDVHTYDGVSFWARRGPNSQAGIGLEVGDRYTDDDLSFLTYVHDPTAPRHCERVRQCACSNHKPCTFSDSPGDTYMQLTGDPAGYYCLPPDPIGFQSISGQGSNVICDITECNQPYSAYPNMMPDGGMTSVSNGGQDPQFFGRPCTPYTWIDGVGSSYCFDPNVDPPPVPTSQICGDHWMKVVTLDNDWKFYRVPFTDLRQQGWAKKSEKLDLTAVSVVRFVWGAGWIDYWIDDVSFYRDRQ